MDEPASIVVRGPGQQPRRRPLDEDQLTIGLDPSCGLTLRDEKRYVGRLHCTLDRINGVWWLHDNASRNGVFVNGSRVDGRQKLYDGDVVRIVDWELTFHDPLSTNVDPDPDTKPQTVGPSLQYDRTSMRLKINGREFEGALAPKERALLNCLAQKPGQVCTYNELIKQLWDDVGDESAVHGLARRLRDKIEPDSSNPMFIKNVPGFGYRLDTNPPADS